MLEKEKTGNPHHIKIMGVDLAGKTSNPTGISVLDITKNERIKTHLSTLFSDEEILKFVNLMHPSLIVVDAPLSLPKGRCCLEKDCDCAIGGHFRQSEREIRRYGPVLPLTFTGMKMLTMRGVGLARALSGKYQIKETHPRTVQKMLVFENLEGELKKYLKIPPNHSEHELDATLAALCGFFYVNNCFIELGDVDEGTIILPKNHYCLKRLK